MRNDTKLDLLWDEVEELKKSGGGGSDLPDVTEADNGKVLGVVNGAWNKMDAPAGGVNYSTTEQSTGLTWVDGSPIYQKTILVNSLDYGGTRSVEHGIENLATVIDARGIGTIDNALTILPYTQGTNQSTIRIDTFGATTFNVTIGTTFSTNLLNSAFTLLYTKTTTTKSKKKTTK